MSSSYCRCGAKFDLSAATKRLSPSHMRAKQVYVCSLCDKISHAVPEERRVIRSPRGARALLNSQGKADGRHIITWVGRDGIKVETVEYFTYPRKIEGMSNEPLIHQSWALLMTKVEVIMAPPNGPSDNELEAQARDTAKHQARGIAEVLTILMQPFFAKPNDVVKAAVARHKDPDYEVPGLGEHLFNPMMNADNTPRTSLKAPTETKTATRAPIRPKKPEVVVSIPDEEVDAIRSAIETGMFDEALAAKTFGYPLAAVKAALAR